NVGEAVMNRITHPLVYGLFASLATVICLASPGISLADPPKQNVRLIVKELARYEKGGRLWRNLVIQPKIKKEELIGLAQKLHRENPTTAFRFFTDDKQFQQFADWDKNYPSDAHPSPEGWVKKHYVAIINRMEGRWQLYAMDAGFERFKLEES